MKKPVLSIFLLCFALQLSLAIDAGLSYATFKSPDQSYVEIYLFIAGKTVTFVPAGDSTYQAGVEVIILFKREEEVVKYDKYVLNSPVSQQQLDFIDLKRYGLDNGRYQLIVALTDVNNRENAKEYNSWLTVDYDDEALLQSDIELLASFKKDTPAGPFVKNGIHLEPLPYNFYDRHTSTLTFYNEIYNSDKAVGEDFMVSYAIERLTNGKAETVMIGHKRQTPKAIIPLLIRMDISKLPSGNYNLLVETRNRDQQLLSRKNVHFQRSNPLLDVENLALTSADLQSEFVGKMDAEQLEYSLRAITALIPTRDVELVDRMIKDDSLQSQRLYLFRHWAQKNPANAAAAYQEFMAVADAVDKLFKSGFRYGFETDRGYIYLKYGQPDDIESREDEPSAPPYEIWSYYDFPKTRQNNVKFVFYNPSLAPGDFVLLHSNARGELNNPQWLRQLYGDAPNEIKGDYFEGTEMQDNFLRNAERIFNNN